MSNETPSSSDNLFANLMQDQLGNADVPEVNELDLLKQRAKQLGISFSPNTKDPQILKDRINAKLAEENPNQDTSIQQEVDQAAQSVPTAPAVADTSAAAAVLGKISLEQIQAAQAILSAAGMLQPSLVQAQAVPTTRLAEKRALAAKRAALRKKQFVEEMKLVRLRITNLDPKKKDLHGEILTFANSIVGTVRKFVPFGEATENGYHVPYCLYKMMKRRKFLQIKTRKDPRTGTNIVESGWVREFAMEVLPPLTPKELAQLATAQQAAGGVD